jgi:ribosomal protein L11 methyltransferase
MDSIQISIEAKEELQEILISELSDLGADGFEQTKENLIAYFNSNTFRSYDVNSFLKNYKFQISTIAEQNWNEVWESNFEPIRVNEFCAIRAEFHEPATGVEHEIIITPKMSFGTGHHATTYMMIEQMRAIDFKDKKVFDFGTGTGILAILGEKLGASNVLAIDVDEWSIVNARENITRNECSNVTVNLSSQISDEKFDIILANINRNVILQYLEQLVTVVSSGGTILFSGLLNADQQDIVNACQDKTLRLVKQNERSGWISLLFVKDV